MANLFESFNEAAEKHANCRAIGFFEDGRIAYWSYAQLKEKVLAFAAGLTRLGLEPGERIAVISANHPTWSVFDFAIARQGLVMVPIHTVLTAEQILTILRQSKAKALVLGPGVEDKLAKLLPVLPLAIETIIHLNPDLPREGLNPAVKIIPFTELQVPVTQTPPAPVLQGSEVCTIIFTSGTTGDMKGVLLTQNGLVDSALEGNPFVGASQNEELLSVLPLSHAFERTAGLFGPLFIGAVVNYGRGLMELAEDIRIFRPTRVNAVPRLLEKIESGIQNNVRKSSERLSQLFRRSLDNSVSYRKLRQAGSFKAWLYFFPHFLADRIFYRKIRKKLGGRLRSIICGGAPLDPGVNWFFEAVGIPVLQGYGLTEVSPIVSVNPIWKNKIGSVGIPLKCIEVKLGDKEEILVRGSSLMKGYDNEAATREAIDAEGWFHTGDQGMIDEDGYLYVKGRVKELIVTSYGKNVIPSLVEQALEKSPLVHQAAAFGHGKAYLTALIVPNREAVASRLQEEINGKNWSELCRDRKVRELLDAEIQTAQKVLPSYEQIKKFHIIPEEFSQDNDLLTPTLKLKRRLIEEKYRNEIAALYRE